MHCSGEQCRKRWTTLREHFSRKKKKLDLPSGSGAADNQQWALYEAMMFLSPYVMRRPVHCSTNSLLGEEHYPNVGTLSQVPTLTPVPMLTPFPRRVSSSPALWTQMEHHFVGTPPPNSSIPTYNQYVIEEQPSSYRQTCQSFSTDSPPPSLSPSPSCSRSSSNRKRHAAALETGIRKTFADPAHAAIRACGDMIVHTIIGLKCPILQARATKSMTDLAMSFQIQNHEKKNNFTSKAARQIKLLENECALKYFTETISLKYRYKLRLTVSILYIYVFCGVFPFVNSYGSRLAVNDYKWPNPGDPEYRTYIHNDRRYGHYQPKGYGSNWLHSQRMSNDDTFDSNNPYSAHTSFPGVLAGWREDLQGKERGDSLSLERDVFVNTNYGQIQGFKVYMYDNPDPKSFYRPYHSTVDRIMGECSVFLGIPYALPPILEGRLKPPRLHPGWQLLQAVDFGPACPQPVRYTGSTEGIMDMDEDCLYLNVFSPETGAGVAQKYPVMVYIHGGEFIHGASNLFQGHILTSFYDVVVVTLNYRLGALGFLSTADENSPGNYGIFDQVLAIKWIYDNIEFFNGDRDLITLFGPGAGAASAGLLMVAPQTKNLIKNVIAMSGSALADWALIQEKYRAQNTSRTLGQLLGCSTETSRKLVNCLRFGRSFYELGNAEFPLNMGRFPWGPVLDYNSNVPGDDWYDGWREKDWKFLPKTPIELIRQNHYNRDLHYMTGVTTQEAASFVTLDGSLAPHFEIDNNLFYKKIHEHVFHCNYTLNTKGVFEAIKYMYTYWPDPNNKSIVRDQYINMLSDLYYRAPTDKIVKLLVENKVPVYMYVLNTTVEALNLPDWKRYPHEIEHYFLTGAPFMDIEFFPKNAYVDRNKWTDNDRNMSHFFMKTFSNFARYGNPTPQQVLGLHYERAYQGELRYLNINTTYNSSIFCNYRQMESAFWTQYLPNVIGTSVHANPPLTECWWEPKEPLQIALWSISIASFFLMVLVMICCIMWRNAKRQSNRFYDDNFFINNNGTHSDHDYNQHGNEPVLANRNAVNLTENMYNLQPSLSMKTLISRGLTETTLIRSPSSQSMTQKTGSQSTLKSVISLKELNCGSTSKCTSDNIPSNNPAVECNSIISKGCIFANGTVEKSSKENSLLQQKLKSNTHIPTTQDLNISTKTFNNDCTSNKNITPERSPEANLSTLTSESFIQKDARSTIRTQMIEGIPQTSV